MLKKNSSHVPFSCVRSRYVRISAGGTQVCFFKKPRHDKYGKYQGQYEPYHRVALPEHLGRGNGIFCKVERTRIDARVVITEITKICPEKKQHYQCSSSKII